MLHGFYLALALNVSAVFCLAQVKPRALGARLVRIDRLLGNLSYPMFLLHFPVAYVLTAVLSPSARLSGGTLLILGPPAVNLVALLVVVLVDHPMEPRRAVVRTGVATDVPEGLTQVAH